LLRHRTGHLLAGSTSRGLIANTDVAIAHDCYPSLDGELRQRGTNEEVARSSAESARPVVRFKAEWAFANGFFNRERLKTRRDASNRNALADVSSAMVTGDTPMRVLSYLIALAFVLTGPSLAGSADRDMPGVGTFTYCGSPIVTPARGVMAHIGQ
jgi:hypothetical protein